MFHKPEERRAAAANAAGRVLPIKFKVIGENDATGSAPQQAADSSGEHEAAQWRHQRADNKTRRRLRLSESPADVGANFSLEQSAFPAVLLDGVSFSVDRSQQQANFLQECICRLGGCLDALAWTREAAATSETAESAAKRQLAARRVEILKSVRLSVPRGSIFGLLGPSSCGKTTLLRCLVGLLTPTAGSVRLFGDLASASARAPEVEAATGAGDCVRGCGCGWWPGRSHAAHRRQARACQVPGAGVGYMPQDLGLYEDFTIEQLLTMFGQYMRMEAKVISQRVAFMADFLELPDVGRQIQTLSGGQKRRVSFAIACLHSPPLIILDEPTVGVDPLLRQSIWKYLRQLASAEHKTIIITTHYIEEAAQADQVALMRAGQILVQDTPARIMALNKSRTLEEAFLKICNSVDSSATGVAADRAPKLFPQPQFSWNGLGLGAAPVPDSFGSTTITATADTSLTTIGLAHDAYRTKTVCTKQVDRETVMNELKLRAEQKLALYEHLNSARSPPTSHLSAATEHTNLSMAPNVSIDHAASSPIIVHAEGCTTPTHRTGRGIRRLVRRRADKLRLNDGYQQQDSMSDNINNKNNNYDKNKFRAELAKNLILFWALLYKNYRRNVNSLPLLAFQFMLPMIQMISFSLCVGGRPTNVGLGVVNRDQPIAFAGPADSVAGAAVTASGLELVNDSLALRYLSLLDSDMLRVQLYDDLERAKADVRRAKLWAVLEIGDNFTDSILKRFDPDNFYELETATIAQSVIKLYPDRSNKILDMICHRSLVDSYRKFLAQQFEHFKRLPIEVARPIFDIAPNLISNSIDGYTESIAPGLLASLTYIMAAGLTTFIMVVERSAGILERTYTSGIRPVTYLLAHALFRSLVMMLQIGAVLLLTFYILRQPLVGSLWLAYAMLMVLNITGIAYGLLISSIVTDQNGAALTIVSSLVLKITMSGILWPFEAIPQWLRAICYLQPLTMPVQALKAITLKGASLGDRPVNLGFLVALTWLLVFLVISTKRFKFYQH